MSDIYYRLRREFRENPANGNWYNWTDRENFLKRQERDKDWDTLYEFELLPIAKKFESLKETQGFKELITRLTIKPLIVDPFSTFDVRQVFYRSLHLEPLEIEEFEDQII
jgi:hypothetical protein